MELSINCNGQRIQCNITNKEFIDNYLLNKDKEEFIKFILNTGFSISKCLNPITTPCSCCDKIDELSLLMEPFNTGGNSSKNGQIGEIFASALFIKRNPHILYKDTSKIEKSGDAIIYINNHLVDKIMIDYKNYDTSIPSDEVTKLVRDLHAQNINYGILISYKSKISKRNYIDYDIIDGKLIVFVAAYGMDIFTLEMAIQYLQKLHECNILSISHHVSELVTKGTMKKITEIYEKIYELSYQQSQNINSMKENQDKINKMFYSMISNSHNLLTSMNLLIDDVNNHIKEINIETNTSIHSFSVLIDHINRLVDKEKDKLLSKQLLNIVNELNIDGFYSEIDNCIHFSNIGKLHITKSKITMIFYNHSDGICSYNRKYESIKNDNFHIILSDEPEKWNIIKVRFRN